MIELSARVIERPLNQVFTIARGSKSEAVCLVVELSLEGHSGRGEAVPYARYGETPQAALESLQSLEPLDLENDVRAFLPPGAARNALDCALWDLRAKISQNPVNALLGIEIAPSLRTAQTLSLDAPAQMAKAALALDRDALIKIKLGGEGDVERLNAIRAARPDAALIVDANEGWTVGDYEALIPELLRLKVEMIEQPFAANEDHALSKLAHPIPICADESLHICQDIDALKDRYDMFNIKLDKSGGLSEALDMVRKAEALGKPYMMGCMVASSLAMAPAFVLAKNAAIVDLDGPLFLRHDEEPAMHFESGRIFAPDPRLWG